MSNIGNVSFSKQELVKIIQGATAAAAPATVAPSTEISPQQVKNALHVLEGLDEYRDGAPTQTAFEAIHTVYGKADLSFGALEIIESLEPKPTPAEAAELLAVERRSELDGLTDKFAEIFSVLPGFAGVKVQPMRQVLNGQTQTTFQLEVGIKNIPTAPTGGFDVFIIDPKFLERFDEVAKKAQPLLPEWAKGADGLVQFGPASARYW